MALASLFALIDDIASVLDDVSALTQVAARKTAGVLGDDLALNAEQVSGVSADRELPVVWAVAKGSLRNKVILVPAALAISAWLPWAVLPLLMLGGSYLCFEGVEKLVHSWAHRAAPGEPAQPARSIAPEAGAASEREKVQGAIRTDFVLSAEIVTITLGTVATAPLATQLAVLSGVAVLMTVGVYGLVAAIVKLDDAGLYLCRIAPGRQGGGLRRMVGRALLMLAPRLMHGLATVGTVAMFLVGGGILAHGWPAWHAQVEALQHLVSSLPWAGQILGLVADVLLGVACGAIILTVGKIAVGAGRALRAAA
jgi:predicted DNA repair protein MutK